METDREKAAARERSLLWAAGAVAFVAWSAAATALGGVPVVLVWVGGAMAWQALRVWRLGRRRAAVGLRVRHDLQKRVDRAARVVGVVPPTVCVVERLGRPVEAVRALGREWLFVDRRLLCKPADSWSVAQVLRRIDFLVGREVARLASGQLAWRAFLAPALMIPWLGSAYREACDETCERWALAVAHQPDIRTQPTARAAA